MPATTPKSLSAAVQAEPSLHPYAGPWLADFIAGGAGSSYRDVWCTPDAGNADADGTAANPYGTAVAGGDPIAAAFAAIQALAATVTTAAQEDTVWRVHLLGGLTSAYPAGDKTCPVAARNLQIIAHSQVIVGDGINACALIRTSAAAIAGGAPYTNLQLLDASQTSAWLGNLTLDDGGAGITVGLSIHGWSVTGALAEGAGTQVGTVACRMRHASIGGAYTLPLGGGDELDMWHSEIGGALTVDTLQIAFGCHFRGNITVGAAPSNTNPAGIIGCSFPQGAGAFTFDGPAGAWQLDAASLENWWTANGGAGGILGAGGVGPADLLTRQRSGVSIVGDCAANADVELRGAVPMTGQLIQVRIETTDPPASALGTVTLTMTVGGVDVLGGGGPFDMETLVAGVSQELLSAAPFAVTLADFIEIHMISDNADMTGGTDIRIVPVVASAQTAPGA